MAVSNQDLGALAIIPQVFFDVIGRLLPGALLIMVFLVVGMGPEKYWQVFGLYFKPHEYHLPSAWLLFASGVVASYLVSIILWGGWYGLCVFESWARRAFSLCMRRKFCKGRFRSKHRIVRWVCSRPVKRDIETWISVPEKELRMKMATIKSILPAAGTRVTKIKAEIHMSATLFMGLTVCSLINAYLLAADQDPRARIVIGVFLLLGMLGAIGSKQHFIRHMELSIEAICALIANKNANNTN